MFIHCMWRNFVWNCHDYLLSCICKKSGRLSYGVLQQISSYLSYPEKQSYFFLRYHSNQLTDLTVIFIWLHFLCCILLQNFLKFISFLKSTRALKWSNLVSNLSSLCSIHSNVLGSQIRNNTILVSFNLA